MKKNHIKTLAFYAILIVGVIVAVSFMFSSAPEDKITYFTTGSKTFPK